MRQDKRASRLTVPYTGSTTVQPSGPGCKPPRVAKTQIDERGEPCPSPHRHPRCPRSLPGLPSASRCARWVNELWAASPSGWTQHGRRRVHQGRRGTADFAERGLAALGRARTWRCRGYWVSGSTATWLHVRCPACPQCTALAGVPAGRGPGAGSRGCAPANCRCTHVRSTVDGQPAAGPGDAELGDSPPVDRLVVCHGDACSPNTILDDTGHVADTSTSAISVWPIGGSTPRSRHVVAWNFPDYPGQVRDDEFFAAYGVAPDPACIDYRRLWQAEDDSSR